MVDNAEKNEGAELPPKLNARLGKNAEKDVAKAPMVDESAKAASDKGVPPAAGGAPATIRIQKPAAVAKPAAESETGTIRIKKPGAVPNAADSSKAAVIKKKSETSKVSLDDTAPAEGRTATVRVKSVSGAAKAAAAQKKSAAGAAKEGGSAPVAVKPVAPAPDGTAKSATSKIALDKAKPGSSGGRRVETIRVKAPGAAAAPAAATAVPASESSGAATIRVKKPGASGEADTAASVAEPTTSKRPKITETAQLPEEAMPDAIRAESPVGSTTIRLKRPTRGGSRAPESDDAGKGPKTIRIKRPDEAQTIRKATTPDVEEEEDDNEPVARQKKRTISLKRVDSVGASERTDRLAQQEEDLKRTRGTLPSQVKLAETPPKHTWAWCLVTVAAMALAGLGIWVANVQIFPQEEELKWPDRILEYNDEFFKHGELVWLKWEEQ